MPWSVLFRSLAIQGSWNYQTLTGAGFAFVIMPALRRIYADDPAALEAAVQRHAGAFNSHPYLAPLAIGAVIRMEEDGEDPAVIDRFKVALRGSLGTLGDQLVWTGWRPVCLLSTLLLLLLGVPWWVAILAFLVCYNIGHLGLMYWGLSVGLAEGRGIAGRLRQTVSSSQPRLMAIGAFLAGVVVVLVALRGVPELGTGRGWVWPVLAGIGAIAGARWGDRVRRVAVGVAIAVAAVGLATGVLA